MDDLCLIKVLYYETYEDILECKDCPLKNSCEQYEDKKIKTDKKRAKNDE